MPKCACGCGADVLEGKKYVRFHHLRVKTPEHLSKLVAMLPRARANISPETLRTTSARGWAKASAERHEAAAGRWRGVGNPNWNASGVCKNKSGRVYIKVPGYGRDGWKPRHRHVAECALGRALRPGEVVHHIDENKSNDAPSNLLVCTDSYHKMLHRKLLRLKRKEV